MSGNGNSGNTGGSSSTDDTTVLNLTYAALAISIGAFILSTLQALLAYLQFDNSEVGRRRCSDQVMGQLWANKTERKFKWREWRYQVFFEVPVFYTAPPGITVGPLTKLKPKDKFLDRFWPKSTNTESEKENSKPIQERAIPMEVIDIQKHVQTIYKITGTENSCHQTMTQYTTGNEKWANVHTAEDEGCSWVLLLDALQAQEQVSRAWDGTAKNGLDHTICYLLQRKRRCWDFMPLNTTKPFATTTICHLVEMMSMLGLVWKEFDMKNSTLSAEGNGYMLKSEYILGLGILTRFSRLLKAEHKEHRIVPCDELKRLCFGEVPSLFDTINETLQVSPTRIEYSLKRLLPGLKEDYRKYFLDTAEGLSRPLIFPIHFELIAMLAKSVHIPGSRFRRLPNPCAVAWRPGLDPATCLSAFADAIKDRKDLGNNILTTELDEVLQHGRMGSLFLKKGQTLAQKIRGYINARTTHNEQVSDSFYYPEEERQVMKDQAAQNYKTRFLDLLDALHWTVERVDERMSELLADPVRRHVFSDVIALHLTKVIRASKLDVEMATATKENPKEKILVEYYMKRIYPVIINGSPSGSSTKGSDSDTSDSPADSLEAMKTKLSEEREERSAIWLGLMFRMWSWLFLHDFNPEDKMIERSEFKNNRLPVYIG